MQRNRPLWLTWFLLLATVFSLGVNAATVSTQTLHHPADMQSMTSDADEMPCDDMPQMHMTQQDNAHKDCCKHSATAMAADDCCNGNCHCDQMASCTALVLPSTPGLPDNSGEPAPLIGAPLAVIAVVSSTYRPPII